jgi:DNA-binding response OmpR family regulator
MGRARDLVRRPSMVGSSGDVSMRVLAFEDSYDIEKILLEGGVDLSNWEILQYWNTMDCFERIDNFQPDLLLLDHYIPPVKGLEVLRGLLELVSSDKIQRPKLILGISSSSAANEAMVSAGADSSIGKFQLANHEVWRN